MFLSVINEYGISWIINRGLYVLKLRGLKTFSFVEKLFEKPIPKVARIDLFEINAYELKKQLETLSVREKDLIISRADQAIEGKILGFSNVVLDYGRPINWQLNPFTGKTCDISKKWFEIPDLDGTRGDIKLIWEASRFSHFITLARAYLLTDDKKYYKAFRDQLKDWLEKNPYSFGANFKCGQECSLRMVNCLLAFTVFRYVGVATDADACNVKDLIDRCYRKVLSNFFYAYKCIKNNHTISELMGMIVGAWCCEDERQLEKAYDMLDEVIKELFTADGGYRQFSFNYQRLALQDLDVIMSISRSTGKSLDKCSIDRIRNAARLMHQCEDETGDMPNYGSNDGALVFPVTSCGYRDFRPVINTAYALSSGKQLYEEGKHQEELIWFSEGRKLEEYPIERVERVSSQFTNAGLFTIRGDRSWVMVVSNDYHSRPAHMDQNHIDLWIDGVNVLCDGGTYSYASKEGRRLVKNESHNTAVVDGLTQMNSSGPFMIFDWTKRILGLCDDTNFEGETVSANGYSHIRKIKLIGSTFEITDKVDKDYSVLFHTPCEIKQKKGIVALLSDGKIICEIKTSGDIIIQESQRSLYYLKKENVNCLIIKGQAGREIKTTIDVTEGENKNG